MATVTLTLEEYEALREMAMGIAISPVAEIATEKPKRKASAYSKRYGKAFDKIEKNFKKKNGEWKKNGFKNAVNAAHKLAKTNRKL